VAVAIADNPQSRDWSLLTNAARCMSVRAILHLPRHMKAKVLSAESNTANPLTMSPDLRYVPEPWSATIVPMSAPSQLDEVLVAPSSVLVLAPEHCSQPWQPCHSHLVAQLSVLEYDDEQKSSHMFSVAD